MADYTISTYISVSRQDSNAVPTANPPFSGSSNSAAILRILPDVTGSRNSKMTAAKSEVLISQLLVAAIFKIRLPVTSGRIRNSNTELLDPENVGVPVGPALLSSLEAEI